MAKPALALGNAFTCLGTGTPTSGIIPGRCSTLCEARGAVGFGWEWADPAGMKKDLLTFAFLFQGYSLVKVNLAHLVPSRAKGPVPSLHLVSLRFIPDPLTISSACSEFSEKHGCFLAVTSALHSSWSFKKISDYYNSVNEKKKPPQTSVSREFHFGWWPPSIVDPFCCGFGVAVCGSALPSQHLHWWR